MDYDKLAAQLEIDEGNKQFPYTDSVGKLTIGIGRNLTDVGLSQAERDYLLNNDVARSVRDLDKNVPWWRQMTDARQRALCNMCFNMGWGDGTNGLSSFKNSLELLRLGKYEECGEMLKKSKWYRQVGARADRIITLIKVG